MSEPLQIAFRNGHYLIAVKPRGLPVHATRDPNRANLFDQVQAMFVDGDGEPDAERPVTLPHRLDVWTSGLVVFGISTEARSALTELFEQRRIDKRYVAVCVGSPAADAGELRHHLAKRRTDGNDRMVPVRSGGKLAVASYEVATVDDERGLSVVQFRLETGRMHQLRVQAAESGWPILGDPLYGDPAANRSFGVDGQLLHAERLAFTDPIQGIPIDVTTPPPADFGHFL